MRFLTPVSLTALLALAACGGGDPVSTGDTGVAECTNPLRNDGYLPAKDAPDAYFRTTVEAKLSDAEADATLAVATVDGTSVAGSVVVTDKVLVFTPDAPLSTSTDYTATVSYSCGDASWNFTTSAVGDATDAAALVGTTYKLDLASGRFVQPEGIGALIQSYLTTEVLMGVASVEGSDIRMIGAIADATGAQDVCTPSIPFPTASFSENPYFEVGPKSTTFNVQGQDVEIGDLFISGSFAADGSYIAGAVLKGTIDTRPLAASFTPSDPINGVCKLAIGLGVACEPCTDGEAYCLSLHVDSISAVSVTGSLEELHTSDAVSPADTSKDLCIEHADVCGSLPVCGAPAPQ